MLSYNIRLLEYCNHFECMSRTLKVNMSNVGQMDFWNQYKELLTLRDIPRKQNESIIYIISENLICHLRFFRDITRKKNESTIYMHRQILHLIVWPNKMDSVSIKITAYQRNDSVQIKSHVKVDSSLLQLQSSNIATPKNPKNILDLELT